MRRNANREERGGRLLSALAAAVLLTLLLGIIHRLYHCEYTDTDTPNDCFAVSAATGETALPKMVCLTFDDGPSKNTVPILEILDREQVPATFFVCAQDANERYLPLVADIAAAGHQIALHSATHQYSKIYASTDAFWQDIKALRQALEPYVDVGGIDWLRFPGGSTNTVSHRYGGRGIMKTLKAQAEQKDRLECLRGGCHRQPPRCGADPAQYPPRCRGARPLRGAAARYQGHRPDREGPAGHHTMVPGAGLYLLYGRTDAGCQGRGKPAKGTASRVTQAARLTKGPA